MLILKIGITSEGLGGKPRMEAERVRVRIEERARSHKRAASNCTFYFKSQGRLNFVMLSVEMSGWNPDKFFLFFFITFSFSFSFFLLFALEKSLEYRVKS